MNFKTYAVGVMLCVGLVACIDESGTSASNPVASVPVVSAGVDQSVESGASVTLAGTASDADGDTLTLAWTQSSGTSVTLNNATTAGASFTAPSVTASEVLVFQLEVSDGTSTLSDSVNITVVPPAVAVISAANFSNLTSSRTVSCTLENGNTTTCLELVFPANTVGSDDSAANGVGPFCPPTTSTPRTESGFGVYDGATNPGFQFILDAATNMEADGYDIISPTGAIYAGNPTPGSADPGNPSGASTCLTASFDDSLTQTFLIPTTPQLRSSNYTIETVGNVGVGVEGVVMKGDPPSATAGPPGMTSNGTANIPSLDHCGGHPDPFGYYHWHFIANSANNVLGSSAYNFTNLYGVSCSNSGVDANNPSGLGGYAMDGFPIYGARDDQSGTDVLPATRAALDDCNGHTHATAEYAEGVYHYHALDEQAPNMLSCIKGSFANSFFTSR